MADVIALHERRVEPVAPRTLDTDWDTDRATHRRVRRKHMLYRSGQVARTAYVVHAGIFKCTVLDEHGRERVTAFALKGDVLGVEALASGRYAADVMALDVADVIELPQSDLLDPVRGLLPQVAGMMSTALARDWSWMLALHALDAEQRVAYFLLDLSARLSKRGYSADELMLRMTRYDIGSFLDIASESVVRALTRLEGAGLIRVDCRNITILDRNALVRLLAPDDYATRATPSPRRESVH
ncbi:Crp/Fnr family transcriptional regulator [Lysobacter sp. TY2-98]|uniref:helix-turn-helix domain-containing protein n=1 Tax=Lysobacter sp. TY2-98 TaxID=2290922 RepID=UPI000E1FB670|nr:helix-turn-helix domain-containing protein [Lysobacter sp. TY2-98]AXK71055.1 Crp/Fnr family transcriptional regulator [Lysobacter sp. TY2-98]